MLGVWGAVLIVSWEVLSSTESTSVTVLFIYFSLIIDIRAILLLNLESMRDLEEA